MVWIICHVFLPNRQEDKHTDNMQLFLVANNTMLLFSGGPRGIDSVQGWLGTGLQNSRGNKHIKEMDVYVLQKVNTVCFCLLTPAVQDPVTTDL